MFAMADRGWTNVPLLWRSIWTRPSMPGGKSSARFLLPAACLIFLGAIQQPLYQILVRVGTISVVTCRDVPSWYKYGDCKGVRLYEEVGRDLEPATMVHTSNLGSRSHYLALGLASLSGHESQPYLWSTNATYKATGNKFGQDSLVPDSLNYWIFQRKNISDFGEEPVPDFFAAGVPTGTTTGVLRQHLMRLNSSVSCQEIDPSEFPSRCPGDHPLTVFWEHVVNASVRICVPGDYATFPWALNRSRQELFEEIYIRIEDTGIGSSWGPGYTDLNLTYTIHCVARTTRGYFELGNNWNNNIHGPLLELWPDAGQMANDFNDFTDTWEQQGAWDPSVKPFVPSDMYVI